MANGRHRTPLDQIIVERGIKNTEIARSLKTGEATVSRWRSGVVPNESARKALLRFLNKQTEFDALDESDLGWMKENVGA